MGTGNGQIVITYDSDVLGRGEFWRGPPDEIHKIRNVIARQLAQHVDSSSPVAHAGMWTAQWTELEPGIKK